MTISKKEALIICKELSDYFAGVNIEITMLIEFIESLSTETDKGQPENGGKIV